MALNKRKLPQLWILMASTSHVTRGWGWGGGQNQVLSGLESPMIQMPDGRVIEIHPF